MREGLWLRAPSLYGLSPRAKKLLKPVFNKTYCINGVYKYQNSSFHISNVLLILLVLQKK